MSRTIRVQNTQASRDERQDTDGKAAGRILISEITLEVHFLACPSHDSSLHPLLTADLRAFPVLSRLLSRPVLSCPVLSCPVLSCPVLSCPVLSYPVLPCPLSPQPGFLEGAAPTTCVSCDCYLTCFVLCLLSYYRPADLEQDRFLAASGGPSVRGNPAGPYGGIHECMYAHALLAVCCHCLLCV